MPSALSEFLPHFGARTFDGFDPGSVEPGGEVPPVVLFDPIAEAEARGRRAGREEAEAEFANRREEEQIDLDFRMAEKEEYWLSEVGAALTKGITDGLKQIEAAIGDQAGRAMTRILDHALRARALGELGEAVQMLLAVEGAVAIAISGPGDLIEPLRKTLARAPVTFSVNADPEVSVTIGDTTIETCIEAWAERIEAAGEADG